MTYVIVEQSEFKINVTKYYDTHYSKKKRNLLDQSFESALYFKNDKTEILILQSKFNLLTNSHGE